ncbi:MAG: uroporphyrinogen decarboxylase [Sutterellaceae bacterium]|nr:uroporphyrinogen decarboxylase [Sutterellaceae bacterium]MDD7442604.1 uroporphyrinogen decarboxylase [Sutterellaceae bacterium]MDY2867248.1 uroporphyrinogen decarboxylase [Mesosutterella sp.]
MTELQNDILLRALQREPVPYTPVWLMRQAGRFLPEYRETRAKAGSFLALAHSPDFATEVTLQPVDRFGLDAAILFSDILTVPDAMGLGLEFVQGEGPVFARPVNTEEAVKALAVPDMAELQYVMDAVTSIRKALNGRVPLFGFSGSPFTLACYMIEGRGSRNWFGVKSMMYRRPDLFQRILDINAEAVASYLNAQIEAGAQAIQIFDTWGGCLANGLYQKYSLESSRRVISKLIRTHEGRKVPVVLFTKGGTPWLSDMTGSGADAIGLDWTADLGQARRATGDQVALQGNLDPAVLLTDERTVRSEARKVIESFGEVGRGGHVFNLGHGVDLHTPVELVAALVDEVHGYSPRYHA